MITKLSGALPPQFLSLLTVLWIFGTVGAQVLTPPYFNLAVGRPVEASATCGVGVDRPELFCKLTGANADRDDIVGDYQLIEGQFCDYCDPHEPTRTHSPQFATDGTERWWQSPPLSRGMQYNEANLTINLGQEFHVAYVFIKMANSPRPGVFALEKSNDFGKTWKAWQYFADTPTDCHTFFGGSGYSDRITKDDSVICTTDYSKVVPLEGGEIVVSLVNNRPSSNNFSYSHTLQDWTKATNVRLRLLRTKTLLGHLMAVARQDSTVTRRYYYSIKDISIGGRCVCNGHAAICDMTDQNNPLKLVCRCQHNTCGEQCETCCPGFVQKPWRPATIHANNTCEPCQCHGHTTKCRYDPEVDRNRSSLDIHGNYEGGGVCIDCQHYTTGINCEKCQFGYYRPFGMPISSTRACRRCLCGLERTTGDCEMGTGRCLCRPEYTGMNCDECSIGYYGYPRCIPCQCNVNGTQGAVCEMGGGQCPCKPNYDGNNCDRCAYGYYNFPECRPCECDSIGSQGYECEATDGQCRCRQNFGGRNCGQCAAGYYNYPACDQCNCDRSGSSAEICDKNSGLCLCQGNYVGARCDRCSPGFYRFPHCIECGCNPLGMERNECSDDGQCMCKRNFGGRLCDQCAPGFYRYPDCISCNCDPHGSARPDCDQQTGQCYCKHNFQEATCNRCSPNFYNYPNCEVCSCNPAGAMEVPGYPLGGCGSHQDGRLCECKERVGGRICDTCKPGYWNLNIQNPDACEDCRCDTRGTLGGSNVCQSQTGQCACKPFASNQRCDSCVEGMYNLQEWNAYGCQACDCDIGGSMGPGCDMTTGQCQCKPRVNGNKCKNPIATHYFPSLYHNMFELEDGRTQTGGAVRYGFDVNVFPEYSWKGYAVFSKIQNEVRVTLEIRRPSLYRVIYRYVNQRRETIPAEVSIFQDGAPLEDQKVAFAFPPSPRPQHLTVTGDGTGVVSTFVLDPGRWTVALKTSNNVLVDYVVLLPQSYYEASLLQDNINKPCQLPSDGQPCKYFVYADVDKYPSARGDSGYVRTGNSRDRTQVCGDREVVEGLGGSDLAQLNRRQTSLMIDLPITQPGRYVLVALYYSKINGRMQELDVDVVTSRGQERGRLRLPGCPYSTLCRQAIVDSSNKPVQFNIDGQYATVTLNARQDIDLAVDSIVAIPADEWTIDYIAPRFKCNQIDGQCTAGRYILPAGATKVEFEGYPNEHRIDHNLPPTIIDTSIRVVKLNQYAPTINIEAIVEHTGRHALVAHYYQPESAGFDVNVDVHTIGNVHQGQFHAEFCPNEAGCRSVVKFKDNGQEPQFIDLSDLSVHISFNSTRPIWLDYILVIPFTRFNAKSALDVQDVDKSAEFISKCGSDGFDIRPDVTGFCRQSVYSLVTDHNNGALRCQCDPDGSTSFNCNQFGGQCPCKPNVIGRTCSSCRTGYYGFPNCRECNCPSGLCEPTSGRCVCPPRVTGPQCNICLPQTFGFDPLIGCEDCNCHRDGVIGDLNCDGNTGECSCKPDIVGRTCDQCRVGYYGFPDCRRCSCDPKGVTPDVCDQRTSQCLCKENVEDRDRQCSQCKVGSFFLEERNPKGCTQCFCFGITSQCDMAHNYYRTEISSMSGWGYTNLQGKVQLSSDFRGLELSDIRDENIRNPDESIYWIASEPYLGNKVTAYGGKLKYTVLFDISRSGQPYGLVHPDVRLEGREYSLVHTHPEQPQPGTPLAIEVDLLETQFRHESSGAPVSREQFMMALSGLRALHIRGSFYSHVSRIALSNVILEDSSPDGRGDLASNVEQCQCPSNYAGPSCERCAEGFYRSKQGPYLGTCIPCQCNNKATSCDPDSGECLNCRDNFAGPQCLSCREGHYQAQYSSECKPCACPSVTNNHAKTCDISVFGDVRFCECLKGYTGRTCERCEVGYWGNPNEPGGRCQECQCSGNIDPRDPHACDPRTGQCVRCINNAGGDRCERCRDWFYGDALNLKNCQQCQCDQRGSDRCDHQSGACVCKPNVVGHACDRCAPGAYGFDSGVGCSLCACGAGSVSAECDAYTGQCQCLPGVTGPKCDQCQAGFWNYGPRGCQRCSCLSDGAVTCDPVSGRCQCLPGVTGENCDRCLPRWIMVPQSGCRECDNCIHALLDDVDGMEVNVTSMIQGLYNVSAGVLAYLRLDRINRTAHDLRPQVDRLTGTGGGSSGNDDELERLKQELGEVRRLSLDITTKSDKIVRSADVTSSDASDVKERGDSLYRELVTVTVKEAQDAVDYVKNVLDQITNNVGRGNVEQMLREAEQMLSEIRSRDFRSSNQSVERELSDAVDALRRAQQLMDEAMRQVNRTAEINLIFEELQSKLTELQNFTRHSQEKSRTANDLNYRMEQLKKYVMDTVERIRKLQTDLSGCIKNSGELLDKARRYLSDARNAYREAEAELSRMDEAKRRLTGWIDMMTNSNAELRPLVDNATRHGERLKKQADQLYEMIRDTNASSQAALRASKAYQDIIDAINAAMNASLLAIDVATQAGQLSQGITDQARTSRERSESLSYEAGEVQKRLDLEIKFKLVEVKRRIEEVTRVNKEIRTRLQTIVLEVDLLPTEGYERQATEAADRARAAQEKAQRAENRVTVIVERLPDDKAKVDQIPIDIAEANRNVREADRQVVEVIKLVPTTLDLLNRLGEQAERIRELGMNLKKNITSLRERINVARDQANLIKVGVHFTHSSSLQARNPKNLPSSGAYTKVSMFFNSTQSNGMLLFVGPESGQVDYMSLEIVNGKLVFKFDLGSGSATLTSTNNVNNGMWHQVIAERNGKKGKMTIVTTVADDKNPKTSMVEGESPGTGVVLQFNPNTKIFVGGVPSSYVIGLQNTLTSMSYDGCIADLTFDEVLVGLWNFVEARSVHGCNNRDTLLEVLNSVYTFGGNGYVVLNRERFNPRTFAAVRLSFKTFSENGLLFLIGKEESQNFLSIELKDGQVFFQYNLGSGKATLLSKKKFNDGKWHTVNAVRDKKDGSLKVDGESESAGRSGGTVQVLEYDNYVYIGGFNGTHTYPFVTQQGFSGCIKDIQLGSTDRNMIENLEAKDILPGCTDVSRVVSFTHDSAHSYLALPSQDIGATFDLTFKMKTTEADGLILYNTDDPEQQRNSLSVSLVGGKIVVFVVVDGTKTSLETQVSNYNDGLWHYVNVGKENRNLRLSIDDTELLNGRFGQGQARLATLTSLLYVGGVPFEYTIVTENVGTKTHFVGCIGDFSINLQTVNFASAGPAQVGAFLDKCHILDPTPAPPKFDPPKGDLIYTTRTPFDIVTSPRQKCALPLDPSPIDSSGDTEGVLFGLQFDSRYEYSNPPRYNSGRAEFTVEFKSTSSDGVMFYVAGVNHVDFMALYLKGGVVTFAFNCGSGIGRAATTRPYNDDRWHKATFSRTKNEGSLTLDDGVETVTTIAGGSTQTVEIIQPAYVGGLPLDVFNAAATNIEESGGFNGCLKNFNYQGMDFGTPVVTVGTQPCSSAIEAGSFFYKDGGHIVLNNSFSVPLDLKVELQVRPRTLSGVLLSVYNNSNPDRGGDYLVLQMVEGNLIFSVDNGKGDISATYRPPAKNALCNGAWHSIVANKAKNVVTLEVDGLTTAPGIGEEGFSGTDTNHPMYIGGVPAGHRGIRTNDQYVGCLRQLKFNNARADLKLGSARGSVQLDYCPAK